MAIFDSLSDKLLSSIKKLRGQGRITEANIEETLKEIRKALLEADVHFKVVKQFVENVKVKALGQEVVGSLQAGQQFIKIVHDELVTTLGSESSELLLKGHPAVIFLVGLQGVGKTTTAAKLALYLRKKMGRKPGMVSLDVYRPAAKEQLEILAKRLDIALYKEKESGESPEVTLKDALNWAPLNLVDVLIVDTAGRSQIDESLMGELERLRGVAQPKETLLVADAMLGQQSVDVAKGFHEKLGLTGLILTKVDGDARGGAALSIRYSVGIPIKFMGVGEKTDALEVFHPDRLASRILDMGDVLSLVEKAQEEIDQAEAERSIKKMQKNQFTVEDFVGVMKMMKKMGGIQSLLGSLPGMGQFSKAMEGKAPEKEMARVEAIIQSMTKEERRNHKILNGSRRLRIAKGSGTQVADVNRFIKQFEQSQKMMGQMMKGRGRMKMPFGMPKLPF